MNVKIKKNLSCDYVKLYMNIPNHFKVYIIFIFIYLIYIVHVYYIYYYITLYYIRIFRYRVI